MGYTHGATFTAGAALYSKNVSYNYILTFTFSDGNLTGHDASVKCVRALSVIIHYCCCERLSLFNNKFNSTIQLRCIVVCVRMVLSVNLGRPSIL